MGIEGAVVAARKRVKGHDMAQQGGSMTQG